MRRCSAPVSSIATCTMLWFSPPSPYPQHHAVVPEASGIWPVRRPGSVVQWLPVVEVFEHSFLLAVSVCHPHLGSGETSSSSPASFSPILQWIPHTRRVPSVPWKVFESKIIFMARYFTWPTTTLWLSQTSSCQNILQPLRDMQVRWQRREDRLKEATFPENLEQRWSASGFIWRHDCDARLTCIFTITFVRWGRIWRLVVDLAQTFASKSISSVLACIHSGLLVNCLAPRSSKENGDSRCRGMSWGANYLPASWPGSPPWTGGSWWSAEEDQDNRVIFSDTCFSCDSGKTLSHIWKSVTRPWMTKDEPEVRYEHLRAAFSNQTKCSI